mmetsp:Transcript_52684/g.125874  ORF Transcript_52684/g.125874 Transcript_52684/m.125874 type:complete len:278 (+) Transcript_52684:1237-2070(+)
MNTCGQVVCTYSATLTAIACDTKFSDGTASKASSTCAPAESALPGVPSPRNRLANHSRRLLSVRRADVTESKNGLKSTAPVPTDTALAAPSPTFLAPSSAAALQADAPLLKASLTNTSMKTPSTTSARPSVVNALQKCATANSSWRETLLSKVEEADSSASKASREETTSFRNWSRRVTMKLSSTTAASASKALHSAKVLSNASSPNATCGGTAVAGSVPPLPRGFPPRFSRSLLRSRAAFSFSRLSRTRSEPSCLLEAACGSTIARIRSSSLAFST